MNNTKTSGKYGGLNNGLSQKQFSKIAYVKENTFPGDASYFRTPVKPIFKNNFPLTKDIFQNK